MKNNSNFSFKNNSFSFRNFWTNFSFKKILIRIPLLLIIGGMMFYWFFSWNQKINSIDGFNSLILKAFLNPGLISFTKDSLIEMQNKILLIQQILFILFMIWIAFIVFFYGYVGFIIILFQITFLFTVLNLISYFSNGALENDLQFIIKGKFRMLSFYLYFFFVFFSLIISTYWNLRFYDIFQKHISQKSSFWIVLKNTLKQQAKVFYFYLFFFFFLMIAFLYFLENVIAAQNAVKNGAKESKLILNNLIAQVNLDNFFKIINFLIITISSFVVNIFLFICFNLFYFWTWKKEAKFIVKNYNLIEKEMSLKNFLSNFSWFRNNFQCSLDENDKNQTFKIKPKIFCSNRSLVTSSRQFKTNFWFFGFLTISSILIIFSAVNFLNNFDYQLETDLLKNNKINLLFQNENIWFSIIEKDVWFISLLKLWGFLVLFLGIYFLIRFGPILMFNFIFQFFSKSIILYFFLFLLIPLNNIFWIFIIALMLESLITYNHFENLLISKEYQKNWKYFNNKLIPIQKKLYAFSFKIKSLIFIMFFVLVFTYYPHYNFDLNGKSFLVPNIKNAQNFSTLPLIHNPFSVFLIISLFFYISFVSPIINYYLENSLYLWKLKEINYYYRWKKRLFSIPKVPREQVIFGINN